MELLEDNHRVELRVYQQKVKHLEYEHRNSLKSIVQTGTSLLETENTGHETRERDLLKMKEQLKFEQMELELVNASKVADIRQQHDKQLIKMRQQFDDGLSELIARCEERRKLLETDLELRRRVEVHEVEERKNQHINDLLQNHAKAFEQMKAYYNSITRGNLELIKSLQKEVADLKESAETNKLKLNECVVQNQKLSEPLQEVTKDISHYQGLLRERTKDQMALRNAKSRLAAINKSAKSLTTQYSQLEEEYIKVERERDHLYNSFEDSIGRVQQQSEFQNQALEQRLKSVEANASKAATQVEEIIRAANLDTAEMARVMQSLNQMLSAKDSAITESKFQVVKLKKAFNDSLSTFVSKLTDLGIPREETLALGFSAELIPAGSTTAPAGLIY
jgi:myosin heavy subunit